MKKIILGIFITILLSSLSLAGDCGNGECYSYAGNGETHASCPQDCFCGNGECHFDETNINCPTDCYCGNGRCDGNYEREARCTTDCQPTCGNGIIELGEVCDDGTLNSDVAVDGCRNSCRDAYCGDGITDTGEACDQGYHQAIIPNVCRDDCTIPYCGDGILDDDKMSLNGPEFYEECDDGNNDNNDGCRNCKLMSNLQQGFISQTVNPLALQNEGQNLNTPTIPQGEYLKSKNKITNYQNKVMNTFERSEILPIFRILLGNQKANVYSVDEFILCFETSGKYFEKVSLEECQGPTIDVIFSENVLTALDEGNDDNEVIIQMYKKGEIDVNPHRFLNKVKFGVAGIIGKTILRFRR